MKKLLFICSLLFSLVCLISCSSIQNNQSKNAQACNIGAVKITTDFATARMDECTRVADNDYVITLIPENTPINSSPWYAFKVQADKPKEISITMRVRGDQHRYSPKMSRDGISWQSLEHQLKDQRLIMKLTASAEPAIIAGQEIINNEHYVTWAKTLQKSSNVSHEILGKSTQGRPLYKIESEGEGKEWIVILGRQHPPEITGALALFPFVETLLANNALANNFREKYNILIIPNINPDGVFAGNWRHNANGFDLNRDWNTFSQVETKQIDNYLTQLVAQGHKIKFAIDFHSTRRDIFYTMPVSYDVEEKYLVKHWLGALDQQMPTFKVIQQTGSNSDLGVSKQYFADKFKVHAITYEMGDNTSRAEINRIAFKASNLLMETLLSDVDHNEK
jgi:predicted deacylase